MFSTVFQRRARCVFGVLASLGALAALCPAQGYAGERRPESPASSLFSAEWAPGLLSQTLPFVVMRPNGRVTLASRAARRLFGLGEEESVNLLKRVEGSPAAAAFYRACRYPFERSETFSASFPGTGGQRRLFRMESSPMGGGSGLTGVALHDLTAEESPVHARLRDRMHAAASSMENPLTVLSGWLEMLAQEAVSPETLRRALPAMERQLDTLHAVARGLTQVSEAGCVLLGEFDLAPVVQDAADALAPRMVESGSSLELSYSETPFLLHGDSWLWLQMTEALLGSVLPQGETRHLSFTATRSFRRTVIELASDGPSCWSRRGEARELSLVRAAVRAQRGEFVCETRSRGIHCYRLTFPAA